MKRLASVLALTLCVVFPFAAARAAEPALSIEEVLDCVLKSLPPSVTGTFVLDWKSAKGEQRKIEGKYWSEEPSDSGRRVVVASTGADPAGRSAYLFSEGEAIGEAWLSTAAQPEARRVAVKGAEGEMFGTDVSLEDFARFARISFPGQVRRHPDGEIGGRTVYVVETRPASDAGSEYSRIVTSLDKELCVPLRRECFETAFENGEKPRKVLSVDPKDIKREGAYGRATRVTLDDRRDGSQTRLELSDTSLDARLPDSFFTPGNLPATVK
jgi:hypothetical protein